jgi:hypothetical protein
MDEKVQKVIDLIQKSDLDQTIKAILIRDLEADGLNDFMKEQIKAYCLEGMKQLDKAYEDAKKLLEQDPTPSA